MEIEAASLGMTPPPPEGASVSLTTDSKCILKFSRRAYKPACPEHGVCFSQSTLSVSSVLSMYGVAKSTYDRRAGPDSEEKLEVRMQVRTGQDSTVVSPYHTSAI